MVVYGRDEDLRASMFEFLRSLDLNPIEWEQAVKATGSASPHTLDVVTKAFEMAAAVVVFMTGDDLAKLHHELVATDDPDYESKLTPQPRANVLFEAGMAIALGRSRTVPVSAGNIRRISNIDGINLVRLDNTAEARNALAGRLENAGCSVDKGGMDWLTAGNFDILRAVPIGPQESENQDGEGFFDNDEVEILKVLFEEGETKRYQIQRATGLSDGRVVFWINELLGKYVISQTSTHKDSDYDRFAICAGQADVLRRAGVVK